MAYFLLRDYNILPKKELQLSLWVAVSINWDVLFVGVLAIRGQLFHHSHGCTQHCKIDGPA